MFFNNHYSIYPFGEFVHYTDKNKDFNSTELKKYLETKKLTNIIIEKTTVTIEDAFMELAK